MNTDFLSRQREVLEPEAVDAGGRVFAARGFPMRIAYALATGWAILFLVVDAESEAIGASRRHQQGRNDEDLPGWNIFEHQTEEPPRLSVSVQVRIQVRKTVAQMPSS
jgi:hypothetical protein